MKRTFLLIMLFAVIIGVKAQSNNKADIKFDKTTIDLGKITDDSPIKNCYFTFTNTGDANLYIHQIITSCSCTGKRYPTHAIKPGESDTIFVTYDAEKKSPRKFRTSITVHSNAKDEMTKLYLKGEILPQKVEETEIVEVED
jgi:hypothetical protein